MHILIYQYWLWFVFIFIIVFFFLTFICTVRWCSARVKPRRETRGVSRSKCGDLITACVPVSWATSIIVSESTDAIDYYDGFGTTELVVGVRAYQWGWEYYYPRDLDLNYNLKKNYSTFTGNSLKYEKSSELLSDSNNLWKFYQNKNSDQIVTPSHLLLVPSDNYKIINLLNFNDIGSNSLNESNSFKKIRILSKTNNSDLFSSYSKFNSKFHTFSKFIDSDSNLNDATTFATKRQINFLNSSNFINNSSLFLDVNSLNKIIKLNFKSNAILDKNQNLTFLNVKKNKNFFNSIDLFFINNNLSNSLSTSVLFQNTKFYFDFVSQINNDSDKKKIMYIPFKILNSKFSKNAQPLFHYNLTNRLNFNGDFFFSKNKQNLFAQINNNNNFNKNFDLSSSNQSFLFANRNIRSLANLKTNLSNPSYTSNLNTILEQYSSSTSKFELNPYFFYKSNLLHWSNLNDSSRYSLSRFNADLPYSPIPSSNPLIKTKEYDNYNKAFNENSSLIFQGKEELTPASVSSIYWNFYFTTFNNDWRLINPINFSNTKDFFYLPMFSFYYDYDFRNWQAFELLEDAFWENSFSVYLNDEYSSVLNHVSSFSSLDKNLISFLALNSSLNDKNINFLQNSSLSKDSKKKLHTFDTLKSPYIYQEDGIFNPALMSFKDFSFFSYQSSYFNSEDSYETHKNTSSFVSKINLNSFLYSNLFFNSLNYSSVLDSFRSDFDEFSWIIDNNFNFLNIEKTLLNNSNFLKIFDDLTFLNTNSSELNDRTSNSINLRSTARNSIVTYGAIQKVFKTRFDENRSNAKLNDFSNSYIKQPFVSAKKSPYESILGKNKNTFFKNIFFKPTFKKNLNDFYSLDSSNNFYFYDFPFLMSLKSDPSRYLWFDWFAKWGFYEVQPSSSSRYAIYGMPYFNKAFEYSSNLNESLNETENYFVRLARSRKNYLTNWVYTPYMLAKNTTWNKNNLIFELLSLYNDSLVKTKIILNTSSWYWNLLKFINSSSKNFYPSHSGLTTFARTNWNPQNSIQSYYYLSSTLVDILTKRENMYRELFLKKNKIINLPLYLTSNPSHPLLKELKSSFLYVDKIVNHNEYSRDIYYNSLNYFNYLLLSSYKNYLSESFNFSYSLDSLFFYFFNSTFFKNSTKQNNNYELLKNQYRPMKKGITNMVRLHATGAIAMPTEMRIQILASSKDVIHSWAIPSAGIKIDCVPGYSSHRVMIFLVSGIFWGQCMEVCGRYHHWMPIIVYFMKRDLFFLWCTHFIFLNATGNSLSMSDRQNINFSKFVSFDKSTWSNQF